LPALTTHRSQGYLYLGIGQHHFQVPSPGLGSRWIRRQVAMELGRGDWDWAASAGRPELEETLERLPPLTVTGHAGAPGNSPP
jgi:hypothetical protein